jgi:hypothetical protein
VKSLIDHDLAPLIQGRDADDIKGLRDLMWQRLLYVGRGGLAFYAIAAVDIALWDLRGVREGKPLYVLLGAEARELPAYGSGVDLPKSLDDLLAQTEGFLERGLPGVKVDRLDFREDEERVGAVRKLIGDDVDLRRFWSSSLRMRGERFSARGHPRRRDARRPVRLREAREADWGPFLRLRPARRGARRAGHRDDRPAPQEQDEALDPGRAQAQALQEAPEDRAALRLAAQLPVSGGPLRAQGG